MSTPITNHENAGVSVRHLRCFLRDCAKTAQAPHIVSVGSGTGCYEFEMTEGIAELRARLILVDPSPESFRKHPKSTRELKPHFATTTDLIASRPEVVGHCVLLLIWPLPGEATYDIDAIKALQPLSVLVLYETNPLQGGTGGSAGSDALHQKFLRNPLDMGYKNIVEARYRGMMDEASYKILTDSPLHGLYNFSNKTDVRLAWFAKRGASIPKDRPSEAIRDEFEKRGMWKD
jgi:hypothetical protein